METTVMPMIRIFLLLCAWSLNAISQAQITLESCKQQALIHKYKYPNKNLHLR